MSMADDRLISGQAWEDFCDQLREAGRFVDKFGDSPTPLDRAEWYRFVTRTLRMGFVKYIENSEPARPRMLPGEQWRQHLFFTSPDQDHLVCEFPEPGYSYRLHGTRGSYDHFVIAGWEIARPKDFADQDWAPQGAEGLKSFNPAMARSSSFLMDEQIDFDDQGRFEVTISATKPSDGRNWLELKPDCTGLLIRMLNTSGQKVTPANIHIERLDQSRPEPVTPAQMAAGLAMSAQHLLAFAEDARRCWMEGWGRNRNEIIFDQSVYLTNGGVADRQFGFGSWEISPEEALVIHFTPPQCDYWNFQLNNIWQVSLDTIEDGGANLQKSKAIYETDGSVRIIVSPRDPGVGGNWLDNYGHSHGTMCLRYVMTNEAPPPLDIRRVPLESLRRD